MNLSDPNPDFPPNHPIGASRHSAASDFVYTPFFCEENIWQLCQHREFQEQHAQVVFISNPARQCPIWNMRAAEDHTQPVIWDYHVILITPSTRLVWDFDSRLGFPVSLSTYLCSSFHPAVADDFKPCFKVIEAAHFLAEFASNREHMLDANGNWQAPPPTWPIIGENQVSNLAAFVDMTQVCGGNIFTFEQLCEFYGLQSSALIASSDFNETR